jgi:DNA-binding NtrC family response regulator
VSTFLIVDADESFGAVICEYFQNIGHVVRQAVGYRQALAELQQRAYDVVISSTTVSGGTLHDLIRRVKRDDPGAEVIVYTELSAIREGVQAVRDGAFSIVQKPFSIPELSFQIKRALEKRGGRAAAGETPIASLDSYRPYNFIGESPQIRKIFRILNRVAKTDAGVIIQGETGTGKELVASAIHYNSHRADRPYVRVNCAALPEQLLESELFGHERGAFTGAERRRVGRFEHADGGTIFLDEVADMSLLTQAKVLRVIQEKEFERLGSNETVKTDVRIISATNRDLTERIQRGLFREDLYYRLNVVTIRLPPLRDRDGDIALLIQFFLSRATAETGKKTRGIDPDAMAMLGSYRWPGNIRELENTIERAVLLAEGDTITVDDLDLVLPEGPPGTLEGGLRLPAQGIHLDAAVGDLIRQALERTGWVQKKAAALLGISSRALNYRIKSLGLTHPSWKRNR